MLLRCESLEPPISQLGQSATSRFVRAESALASTPDIGEPDCHVSVVPQPDIDAVSEQTSCYKVTIALSQRIEKCDHLEK